VFYCNTITGELPLTKEDLYARYPEYNVYQPLPEGIVQYEETERPETTELQSAVLNGVANVDGVWRLQWKIVDITIHDIDHESGEWYLKNPIVRAQNG